MAGKITDYAAATTGAATDLMEVATDIGGTPTSKKISLLNLINSLVGIVTTKLGLAVGGTNANLSATGAATHFLAQASAGAAVTVRALVAADIPGQASDDAHRAASANVHGLAASVNVLGERNGAGRVIQVGKFNLVWAGGAQSTDTTITYPVAFASILSFVATCRDNVAVACVVLRGIPGTSTVVVAGVDVASASRTGTEDECYYIAEGTI